MMFRWVMWAILAVLLLSWLFSKRLPWLEKLGITKLRSHLCFRWWGRTYRIPVTYALVFATAFWMLIHFIYTRTAI